MEKAQKKIDSKIGHLYLVASENALHGVYWDRQDVQMKVTNSNITRMLDRAEKEITEYLLGQRRSFSIPLDAEGTEFQKKVWKRLSAIPYGKTKSYQDIAKEINNPKACRAVGTANGRNPLSLIVPCHRVISADGTLGGYAGGLDIKRQLLSIENIQYIVKK